MRVNNLHFAVNSIGNLQKDFKSQGAQMNLQISDNYYDNMFAPATSSTEKGIITLMNYIGTKVAFYDLRAPLIEDLYIPSVAQGPRLSTIYSPLDQILATVCQTIEGEITNDLISWIYKEVLQAYPIDIKGDSIGD
jgi:hypothetical protein